MENVIHGVIRRQDPNAKPPRLVCTRVSDSEVRIAYASPRKLCSVAKGIIAGLADLYGERMAVEETSCMQQGAAACSITVRSTGS